MCKVSMHLCQWEYRYNVPTAHPMPRVGPHAWGAGGVWGAAVYVLAAHHIFPVSLT